MIRFLHSLRSLMERLITWLTRHGDRAWFDTAAFPWVKRVEAEWRGIREELDLLMLERKKIPNIQDISETQKGVAEGDSWKTFFFYIYSHRVDENCSRCPRTMHALSHIPEVKTAMLSILAPGKHIPEHRGVYKGVLRSHLGLLIPQPTSCRIAVRGEVRAWEEGKVLIFDDSYRHEVWNDSDSYRVVLLVDFVRPLFFPLSLCNRLMIWYLSRTPMFTKAYDRIRHPDLVELDRAARAAGLPGR